jgi:hypothetical protein
LDAGTIVFVTKSGSDYHRAGCNRLDKTETPLTAGEAEKLGFKPCRTCFSTLLGERKPKASAKGKLEGIPREELPAKPAPGPAKPKVSMLDQYKDNPIMKQLGVSVQKDANGNIRGISADNFSSLPLAGMLGFQNGDMIQSINGETIDSEAKMMDLYNRYKDAPSIDVGIVRNGQPQNMPVNLGSITKMFR